MAHTRPTAHQGANAPSSRVQHQRAVAERLAPAPGITVQRFRGKNRPSTPLFSCPDGPSGTRSSAIPTGKRGRMEPRNKPFGTAKQAVSRSHAAAAARRKCRNGRLPRPATAPAQLFRQGAAGLLRPINFTYPQPPGTSPPSARHSRHATGKD